MNTKRGVRGAFPSINAACFSLGELDTEAGRGGKNRAAALCPSILWPGARRTPTKRERERAGEYMGQIFPWQDPWDAAEGRVQPVKERLRARQSISGLHLHNKWSSRGFSSACTRTRTHTPLISTRRHKVAGMKKRERGRGQPFCWSGTTWQQQHKHPHLYCWMIQLRSYKLICFGKFTAGTHGKCRLKIKVAKGREVN